MSYTTMNGMQSARYPLKGFGGSGDGLSGCGCGGSVKSSVSGDCGCGSLGEAPEPVDAKWKWAALGLGGLVIAQFFWWDAKAPQVLRKR